MASTNQNTTPITTKSAWSRSTKHVLNLLPIRLSGATLTGGTISYESKEQLDALKAQHRSTHIVLRDGGKKILTVPFVQGAPTLGEPTPIVLTERHGVACRLMENALIRHFTQELTPKREVLDDDPITLVSTQPGDNLIAASLPETHGAPAWLVTGLVFEMKARTVSFDRKTRELVLAASVWTKRRVLRSCARLLEDGLDLVDLYVGELLPRRDPRVSKHLRLHGRVRAVEGKTLLLADVRPGLPDTLDAELAYPDASAETFARCFRLLFGKGAPDVAYRLRTATEEVQSGPERLRRIRALAKYLRDRPFVLAPGCVAFPEPTLEQACSQAFPRVYAAPNPLYVFEPTGRYTSPSNSRGLEQFGPYSRATHTPTRPRICVVCQESRKGRVDQFINKLMNGVVCNDAKGDPFASGLVRLYDLEGVELKFFTTRDRTTESYMRAVQAAIEDSATTGKAWNLALVQIEERFKQLPAREDPYLPTKAAFLTHQIPSQEFLIETTERPDGQLGFVLANLALAIYAKLGGVPWVLKCDETTAHELVIGLGSARIGTSKFGSGVRMVGITTVFTGDGRYHLSNLSKAVPMDGYRDAVLESLRAVVGRMKQDLAWQQKDSLRVIFHAFKPFRNMEAEAVEALLKELTDYNVECAFLNVVEDHPFLLLDEAQRGVSNRYRTSTKGELAPQRGTYLHLSEGEVLISFTGVRELKRRQDGLPRPFVLRLHRNSNFRDMTYLARQAFVFSGHSWRGFQPAPKPVTVMYSDLIAELLGRLATVPNWDPSVMLGRIGRARWFP